MDTQTAAILICRVLRDAGGPLSRLEISRAIEPRHIPHLREILGKMLEAGILAVETSITDQGTAIPRYVLADNVDCESPELDR